MNSNHWHKQWKPVKGSEGRRARWYNLPQGRIRIEFKDDDGTKAKREFNSVKAAQEAWDDFRHGGITAQELRKAGYI